VYHPNIINGVLMTPIKIGLLTATLCLAVPAFTQDFQPGAHGGINIPTGALGDALDNRPGFTVGGHLGIYYGNGHELRPRIDLTHYQGGNYPVGGSYDKNRINAWQLGCDYLYYMAAQPQGLYLTGGLGYQWWDVAPEHGAGSTHSGVAMAFGAGYRFSRSFMLEGRLTNGQFRSNDGQANALQALASWRF
jgi:hypothetical protein